MKVESIRSRMMFKDYDPRAQEKVPEGVKFLAGAALNLWVPTLMYCYVISQILPFYFMVFIEALGVLLGVLMYQKSADEVAPSCVPVNHVTGVLSDAGRHEKKVA